MSKTRETLLLCYTRNRSLRVYYAAIRLEPKQLAELEKIAKREDRAVSYIIRKAIDEYIKREKSR